MAKKFSAIKGGDNEGQVEHNLPVIFLTVQAKTTMPRYVFLEAIERTLDELNKNSFYRFQIISVDAN
jgi:hypothetical protein